MDPAAVQRWIEDALMRLREVGLAIAEFLDSIYGWIGTAETYLPQGLLPVTGALQTALAFLGDLFV